MTESPLTRIPGAWADRHPVIVAGLICMAFAVFVIAIASTAHAETPVICPPSGCFVPMHEYQARMLKENELKRAREICLKRWWFPGGQRIVCERPDNSVCWGDLVNHPAGFETDECRAIDERWKASGAPDAEKAAAEKAEREDRQFVERVASHP